MTEAWTTPDDIYDRYTNDENILPPANKLEVLIGDAEEPLRGLPRGYLYLHQVIA